MRNELDLYIRPNQEMVFLEDNGISDVELYTVEMSLTRNNIEKLRGYKWDLTPHITIDKRAISDHRDLVLLNDLIEVVSIGYGGKQIHTRVIGISEIENIICNCWLTVEVYFDQLSLLRNGETNYWYLASSKNNVKYSIDEYENALRKYTGDNAWHLSDITEYDKNHVVYEFTNTYDDLYY